MGKYNHQTMSKAVQRLFLPVIMLINIFYYTVNMNAMNRMQWNRHRLHLI